MSPFRKNKTHPDFWPLHHLLRLLLLLTTLPKISVFDVHTFVYLNGLGWIGACGLQIMFSNWDKRAYHVFVLTFWSSTTTVWHWVLLTSTSSPPTKCAIKFFMLMYEKKKYVIVMSSQTDGTLWLLIRPVLWMMLNSTIRQLQCCWLVLRTIIVIILINILGLFRLSNKNLNFFLWK